MIASINQKHFQVITATDTLKYLGLLGSTDIAESWVRSDKSQLLCILKVKDKMLLMYLQNEGDVGVISQGKDNSQKLISFTLANGQVDEYPASWCIDSQTAHEGIRFFLESGGKRPQNINWNDG